MITPSWISSDYCFPSIRRSYRVSAILKTMSSPDIAGILDNSKELDRLRKEQEEVLLEINKMHKKLISSEFLFFYFFSCIIRIFVTPRSDRWFLIRIMACPLFPDLSLIGNTGLWDTAGAIERGLCELMMIVIIFVLFVAVSVTGVNFLNWKLLTLVEFIYVFVGFFGLLNVGLQRSLG